MTIGCLSELPLLPGVTVSPHAQEVVRTVSTQTAANRNGLLIRTVVDGRSIAVPMVMFLGVAWRHHDGRPVYPRAAPRHKTILVFWITKQGGGGEPDSRTTDAAQLALATGDLDGGNVEHFKFPVWASRYLFLSTPKVTLLASPG